jgi:hypothetical protein
MLGCSPGTVKSQAAKGLAKLRVALADDGEPAAPRPAGVDADLEGTR